MAKYYAITEGEYSDYHIVHITTDKKLAEAYVKLHAHKDYDSDYMEIEEYDDLIDQCDIQDTFDKAGVLHPYLCITVSKNGGVNGDDYIREKLKAKDVVDVFRWLDTAPDEAIFDEYGFWDHFKMWVQVDKYDYDYDKIIKVVMDTRAKMLAEKLGL